MIYQNYFSKLKQSRRKAVHTIKCRMAGDYWYCQKDDNIICADFVEELFDDKPEHIIISVSLEYFEGSIKVTLGTEFHTVYYGKWMHTSDSAYITVSALKLLRKTFGQQVRKFYFKVEPVYG